MTIAIDGIALPPGLIWIDEFSAQSVAQTVKRTLDGSLVVFYGGLKRGIPITLESEPDAGWMRRDLVEALQVRASSPGGIYTLQLRDQVFQVMFRHHDAPAFEAKPLVNLATPAPGDYYLATLKLITV
jgi:hypothetical protein